MYAAQKQHTVFFGKPIAAKLFLTTDDTRSLAVKARPLYADGKLKEFTVGEARDITDRQFAVQRIYRVNDTLPGEDRKLPKWRWQRGGWLLVDRSTGRVSLLHMPDFDAFYSDVVWYRDYAAYCGVSDSGDKLDALVVQLGARKPLLHILLQEVTGAEAESPCGKPKWQREPLRVTFSLAGGHQQTFEIHAHAADLTPAEEEEK